MYSRIPRKTYEILRVHLSVCISSDPCFHKNLIQGADRIFEIIMADADDDVQLTGALVDHLHIDMRMGQGREDPSRGSPGGLHAPAYHSDQGQIRFQLDVVRMYGLVDPRIRIAK